MSITVLSPGKNYLCNQHLSAKVPADLPCQFPLLSDLCP